LPILIAPLGIIHRQSSDTTAVDDPLVAAGLRFIRESLGKPIRVVDLQRHLGCSRRVIEYRFEQALGRTPAAEIRRGRLQHARRLLVETDLSVAAIAARVGFHHTEVLIRTFSRELGLPPGAFRKRR
jgi:LacI family transcriptional regulator